MAGKKIALIGTRGVPANYGGFETCVEEVGSRLAKKGHDVTVYCRSGNYEERLDSYKEMKLVDLPTIKIRSFETLANTILSLFHSLVRSFDVHVFFGITVGPFLVLPRLLGKRVVVNTDGLEWKRGKWGVGARIYFKLAEWFVVRFANRIITDSNILKAYYRSKYDVSTVHIAYGADIFKSSNPKIIVPLGLKPGGYFLQVTRFEPENNPLLTIEAFIKLDTDKKLVLIGGVKYTGEYSRKIMQAAGDNIIMPGFVYDKELLNELWCNCYAYIHGNEVGGTNPALLQSMACGACVFSIDVSYNREVMGDRGIYYKKDPEDLAEKLLWALRNSEKLNDYGSRAVERIKNDYSWSRISSQYEKLLSELISS